MVNCTLPRLSNASAAMHCQTPDTTVGARAVMLADHSAAFTGSMGRLERCLLGAEAVVEHLHNVPVHGTPFLGIKMVNCSAQLVSGGRTERSCALPIRPALIAPAESRLHLEFVVNS